MHAIVHFIVEGLVVEGSDIAWFDPARGGGLIVGNLLNETIDEVVAKTHWNNSFEVLGKTNVLDGPLLSRMFNLQLSLISSTAKVKHNLDLLGRADRGLLINTELANEIGLDVLLNLSKSRLLVELMGKLNVQVNLINGSCLVADLHASWGENGVLLFVFIAFIEFRGLLDSLSLFLAFLQGALEVNFLQVVLWSILDFSFQFHL
jgi:hypothetical protein